MLYESYIIGTHVFSCWSATGVDEDLKKEIRFFSAKFFANVTLSAGESRLQREEATELQTTNFTTVSAEGDFPFTILFFDSWSINEASEIELSERTDLRTIWKETLYKRATSGGTFGQRFVRIFYGFHQLYHDPTKVSKTMKRSNQRALPAP